MFTNKKKTLYDSFWPYQDWVDHLKPLLFWANKIPVKEIEKNAYIDWRFDQLGDFTVSNEMVTSFTHVKKFVDQIKKDGFNGIVLNTNVPVDIQSGDLVLYDNRPVAWNRDKNIPKDTWKVVEYAKKIGLTVTINLSIVDYKDDINVASYLVDKNFNVNNFFKNVTEYETLIASIAQKYKVDKIGVGFFQTGLDSYYYQDYWQSLINSVKNVFNGKLTYTGDYKVDTPIWSMVDIISVGDSTREYEQIFQTINSLRDRYQKHVYLDAITVPATDNIFPWDVFSSGGNLKDLQPRYDIQADKIRNILKSVYNEDNKVSGVGFYEYRPWNEAVWIQQPNSDIGKQFFYESKLASEFYDNPTAQHVLLNWLAYSTRDINGTRRNDLLETFAGNKKIDGRDGYDTLTIHNNIENCKIIQDVVNGGFDIYNGVNGIDGIYDVYNVESIKFNNQEVSLVGNNYVNFL